MRDTAANRAFISNENHWACEWSDAKHANVYLLTGCACCRTGGRCMRSAAGELWFCVAPSQITPRSGCDAGLGLFAARDFPYETTGKGHPRPSLVGFYFGLPVQPGAPGNYVLTYDVSSARAREISRHIRPMEGSACFAFDGTRTRVAGMQYANHADQGNVLAADGGFFWVGVKGLKAGDEIVWNYGNAYWG